MRFVDTSFWVALFFHRDTQHETAQAVWTTRPGALLSTNHVLGETWTFMSRRQGHVAAIRVLDALTSSRRLTVLRVPESAETEAWEWLRMHGDREYSFVDATSFAVMRKRRIREALAFDGDFTSAGFIEVRAD